MTPRLASLGRLRILLAIPVIGIITPFLLLAVLVLGCLVGVGGFGGSPAGMGEGAGCVGAGRDKQSVRDCLARSKTTPDTGMTGAIAVSGAWAIPLPQSSYVVGSGFKDPRRGGRHFGVDFIAPRFTPIYAAAAGTVITAECSASTRRDAGSCDVDGSPRVKGCGWNVEILHEGGLATMYCHLAHRPLVAQGQQVTLGQQLGEVGSSGNSSGPHLHFQIHTSGRTTNDTAIDPINFLRAVGLSP